MTRDLAGKHALVTGGSRGIGAAVAQAMLQHGASVTLLGRDPSRLASVNAQLAALGQVRYVAADITRPEQVALAMEQASTQLGPVAVLVNNAGQAASAPFLQTDGALWQRMLDVNLNGAFHCTQAVLPAMRAAGWGRIVNVASSAGLQGYAYVTAYCAAKHGLVGLTRALAVELAGSGVTVNAVCPGYTDTPMLQESIQQIAAKTGQAAEAVRAQLARQNQGERLLSPEEVAQVVLRFCLPEASQCNGDIASLDGERQHEGAEYANKAGCTSKRAGAG